MVITITNIKTILTAPEGINLVAVKVETSEPGLYGVGCATFTQRYKAVVTVIEEYLKPFLIGKDCARIEDIWQTAMVNGYWRNGPVLNNALAGIDMALWDIKGKLAGMPLYQLFGGKCREAVPAYAHADATSLEHAYDLVAQRQEEGYRYIRCQVGGYGGNNVIIHKPQGALPGAYYNPKAYMRSMVDVFDKLRAKFGFELEFCHDVHERLSPNDAMNFAKEMEQFKLHFLEDVVSPENVRWLDHIRAHSITPLAQGELFNNPNEWIDIVAKRLIDYIRIHISQVGGITPIQKIIAFCDVYGVRTAWHGPGDLTPIGHAVNAHMDISSPNFGIQEVSRSIRKNCFAVFPGTPEIRDGYIYLNDNPGIGVDIDEKAAALFPCHDELTEWTLARLPDGSSAKP